MGAKNVIALIAYIWNDGSMPIRRTDVLEQLFLKLPEGSQILEARVLRVSRDVINFTAGTLQADAPNVIPLSFEILEKSDGAAIQIIYAGEPEVQVLKIST